jgi:hypothetical protein
VTDAFAALLSLDPIVPFVTGYVGSVAKQRDSIRDHPDVPAATSLISVRQPPERGRVVDHYAASCQLDRTLFLSSP